MQHTSSLQLEEGEKKRVIVGTTLIGELLLPAKKTNKQASRKGN